MKEEGDDDRVQGDYDNKGNDDEEGCTAMEHRLIPNQNRTLDN
jgi:hypothetical protein